MPLPDTVQEGAFYFLVIIENFWQRSLLGTFFLGAAKRASADGSSRLLRRLCGFRIIQPVGARWCEWLTGGGWLYSLRPLLALFFIPGGNTGAQVFHKRVWTRSGIDKLVNCFFVEG